MGDGAVPHHQPMGGGSWQGDRGNCRGERGERNARAEALTTELKRIYFISKSMKSEKELV